MFKSAGITSAVVVVVFGPRLCLWMRKIDVADPRFVGEFRFRQLASIAKFSVLFIVFPVVCSDVLRIFQCIDLKEGFFLEADVKVECFTSEYVPLLLPIHCGQLLQSSF